MILTVKKPNNIVDSASFSFKNEYIFQLIINTVDRDVYPDCFSSSSSSEGFSEISFGFSLKDSEIFSEDEVILTADNDNDREILKRRYFMERCKDQLIYLFISDKIL